jgi:hypothetical protein
LVVKTFVASTISVSISISTARKLLPRPLSLTPPVHITAVIATKKYLPESHFDRHLHRCQLEGASPQTITTRQVQKKLQSPQQQVRKTKSKSPTMSDIDSQLDNQHSAALDNTLKPWSVMDVPPLRARPPVQDGTWAGNIELQAASTALGVNICVYQAAQPVWTIKNFPEVSRSTGFYYSHLSLALTCFNSSQTLLLHAPPFQLIRPAFSPPKLPFIPSHYCLPSCVCYLNTC